MTQLTRGQAHAALRSGTRSLHERLERGFDPALATSARGYARLLLVNSPFAAIEPALERAGIDRILPDWSARRRRDALAADLHELGITPPDIETIDIASDAGTLLGWSYVLEGSRLGARMILRARDPGQLAHASRFLSHQADGDLWRSYRMALSGIDDDPAAIVKACAGANAAFQCFLDASRTPEAAGAL